MHLSPLPLCGCLQQVNRRTFAVCVGDISAEIKTEADINECACDDTPSTGLFAVSLSAYTVHCICFDVSLRWDGACLITHSHGSARVL